jgi:hypothetical protein
MYSEINKPSLFMIPTMVKDIISYRLVGIPAVIASDVPEMARKIIKENAKDVFIAGKTHFNYMWITDMAVAFKGIKKVLPHSYLRKQLQRIIDKSCILGYVPTCYSKTKNFNMPFKRQDNFPSLIHALYYLDKEPNVKEDPDLEEVCSFIKNKENIKSLYEKYMQNYYDFDNNLLRQDAIHDWMDTIKRPSSTFSNLFLLNMFKQYEELFKENTPYKECEKALLEKRWNGEYFIDYDNCGSYLCADANVPALYFNLFSRQIQDKICDCIESSELLSPVPMKTRQGEYECTFIAVLWAKNYHSLIWPHLGLMYLNGLKRMHRPYEAHLKRFEKNALEYKNFLEVLDMKAKPFSAPFFVTEHSFSMAAGQYLELIN